jgi:hypothetical protein
MNRRFVILFTAGIVVTVLVWLAWPRQEGDPTFDARVAEPAYPSGNGPRVWFDEGHWNVHTADGRYKPLADLLRNDGYRIDSRDDKLTRDALAGYQVLIIANALGFRGSAQHVANLLRLEGRLDLGADAFSDAECDAVHHWVREGGALLLVADHAPAGAAARKLAARFGVEMTNGYAEEPQAHDPETENWSFIVFSRENGLLAEHPITEGRNEAERVAKVMSFTGQSLRAPAGAVSLLRLSEAAREYPRRASADNEFRSAAGLAQGVALEFGQGRVVVLGEAAMITSQVSRSGGREFRFGLSRAGYDNRQLALSILHWLDGTL